MAVNEDDIISGMLEGYKRSNIRKLSLEKEEDLVMRVGMILKDSPDRHARYNVIGFDPVQTAFLRKMISEPILEKKIRTIKKDYYKTVSYLDFFTNFVIADTSILDRIKQKTRDLEQIDPFLDPDIGLCARYCSLEYNASFKPLARNDSRRHRYNRGEGEISSAEQARTQPRTLTYSGIREIDPVYQAAAKILLDQFATKEFAEHIWNAESAYDLEALLFSELNMKLAAGDGDEEKRKDKRIEKKTEEVLEMISKKEYLQAAHASMDASARELSQDTIAAYVSTMEPTRY